MGVTIKINTAGLLDLVAWGQTTERELRFSMRRIVNLGRTVARRLIRSQFIRRTGRLAREAARMRTEVTVTAAQISGLVGPLPRLLNIFERGAVRPGVSIQPRQKQALRFFIGGEAIFARGTVMIGGGFIAPRPVYDPTAKEMQAEAGAEFGAILQQAEARGR